MANPKGICVICGASPTVKSHIFPRALMLEVRAEGKALYESSISRPGYSLPQNGPWDDTFLCKVHEDLAGAGDKYSVNLWRDAESRLQTAWDRILVPNPEPKLLAKFAYGVVWRHVNAPMNIRMRLSLGPFEEKLRAALFHDGPLDLPVLMSPSPLSINGRPAPLGIPPYSRKLQQWRTWHFILGRIQVHVKTDSKPFPAEWHEYTAGVADPLIFLRQDSIDIRQTAFLAPLIAKIAAAK
jgi:hypothetical protein